MITVIYSLSVECEDDVKCGEELGEGATCKIKGSTRTGHCELPKKGETLTTLTRNS